jgi:hypothetical protein
MDTKGVTLATHPYRLLFHISSSTRGGEHMDEEEETASGRLAPVPNQKRMNERQDESIDKADGHQSLRRCYNQQIQRQLVHTCSSWQMRRKSFPVVAPEPLERVLIVVLG